MSRESVSWQHACSSCDYCAVAMNTSRLHLSGESGLFYAQNQSHNQFWYNLRV